MLLKISKEVEDALKNNKPVVALETTIISHGMPYPDNIKTALEVERIIRENGAVPATIGIIDGVGVVGMNEEEIIQFGKAHNVLKVSRRDLPYVISHKLWGATTVSATMILAEMAGIEVFVTGGIGGVHRNVINSFDISADLEELASTKVSVVCSGAKAILDLPFTLEYLETKGVPVLGYKSANLAAFYSADSGLKVDYKMDSCEEIAQLIKTKRDLNLKGGVLISNPIPKEAEIPNEVIERPIKKALKEAEEKNIHGKDITPFLLKTICDETKGESLKANIALIYNNAKIGAQIAVAYAKLNKEN